MKTFSKKLGILLTSVLVASFFILSGCNEVHKDASAEGETQDRADYTAVISDFGTYFLQNNFTKITIDLDNGKRKPISKEGSIQEICNLMSQLEVSESSEQEFDEAGYDGGTQLTFISEDGASSTVGLFGDFVTMKKGDEEWKFFKVSNEEIEKEIFDITDRFI